MLTRPLEEDPHQKIGNKGFGQKRKEEIQILSALNVASFEFFRQKLRAKNPFPASRDAGFDKEAFICSSIGRLISEICRLIDEIEAMVSFSSADPCSAMLLEKSPNWSTAPFFFWRRSA